MRFKLRLAFFAVLQALIAFNPSYSADPDEVIVQFRDRSQRLRISQTQAFQTLGATTVEKLPDHGNIVLIRKAPGESMDDLLHTLRNNPAVRHAEVNEEIRIPDPQPNAVWSADEMAMTFSTAAVPTDPLLTWGYRDIDADQAPAEPDHAPLVAVIDTGVDDTHPELAGRVVRGHDFHNNDDNPMDDHGHGTHVSGIVAAKANNGQGSAGISPRGGILALKVLGANGSGSFWNVAQGVYAAADHPDVGVINLSLGSSSASNTLLAAIEYATQEKGKLVVAAAGNADTSRNFYPARWGQTVPGVIGVAANDRFRCKAWFSNYGQNATIAAPGEAILSTVPGNRYASWSGTSMASPFVAGAAARLLAENPAIPNTELKSLLENNGDSLLFDDGCWPAGDNFAHLNLFAALDGTPEPVPDNEPPEVTIQSPTTGDSYETEQGSIEVAGTASDNVGVNRVTWTNDRGGSGSAEGTTSWTIADLVLQEGENIITATAHDASANASSRELRILFVPLDTYTITLRVENGPDDAYELLKSGKNVTRRRKSRIGKGRMNGYRFSNVTIPKDAVIQSAVLSQYGSRSRADITVKYTGEAIGDAAPFTGEKFDLSQRSRTLEAVTDHPPQWASKGYRHSPNVGAIIQELVMRDDWESGHAINLFVDNEGSKKGRSVAHFESGPDKAAILEIQYSLPE